MDEELQLSEEQKVKLLTSWNNSASPPALKDLTIEIFGHELDGRSKEGRAIKAFLATHSLKPRPAQEHIPKEKLTLSLEQMEYISKNCNTMTSLDMARILFKNTLLTNLNQETRVVNEYAKTLDKKLTYGDAEDVPSGDWSPPKSLITAIARVNKYLHHGIDKDKITAKQRKDLESLIGYLHTFRFRHQINNFETDTDRQLFESTFIRYTYDKSDLTQEEVDQFILLANEIVMASTIQRRSERLQVLLDESSQSGEDNVRIAMSLVEAIGKAQIEYNACVKRQQDLTNSLKEKRSDRLGKQLKDNASILNLVQLWKLEETRNKMIKLAQLQKLAVKEEIDRLMSMEELKSKIMGLSTNEALNG